GFHASAILETSGALRQISRQQFSKDAVSYPGDGAGIRKMIYPYATGVDARMRMIPKGGDVVGMQVRDKDCIDRLFVWRGFVLQTRPQQFGIYPQRQGASAAQHTLCIAGVDHAPPRAWMIENAVAHGYVDH